MAKKKAEAALPAKRNPWDLSRLCTEQLAAGKEIDRVHPDAFGAAQFNDSGNGNARFSPLKHSNGAVIATIYAAETYAAALMETAFHDVPNGPAPKIVRKSKLEPLCRSKLRIKQRLKLADLTSLGLKHIDATKAQIIESEPGEYPLTRSLAEAIHDRDASIQGIQWVSKQHDRALSFLFFGDRTAADAFDPIIEKHPILESKEAEELLALAAKIGAVIGE